MAEWIEVGPFISVRPDADGFAIRLGDPGRWTRLSRTEADELCLLLDAWLRGDV